MSNTKSIKPNQPARYYSLIKLYAVWYSSVSLECKGKIGKLIRQWFNMIFNGLLKVYKYCKRFTTDLSSKKKHLFKDIYFIGIQHIRCFDWKEILLSFYYGCVIYVKIYCFLHWSKKNNCYKIFSKYKPQLAVCLLLTVNSSHSMHAANKAHWKFNKQPIRIMMKPTAATLSTSIVPLPDMNYLIFVIHVHVYHYWVEMRKSWKNQTFSTDKMCSRRNLLFISRTTIYNSTMSSC